MTLRCIIAVLGGILAIAIYFPPRHARHYDYINTEKVYEELHLNTTKSPNSNLKLCNYETLISNNHELEIVDIYQRKTEYIQPKHGGVFYPSDCIPQIKTAVIVPFRNRHKQLPFFLDYIHDFLQKQQIAYRIFIVNQNDTLPFNRGKMLNYGARVALRFNYPCLILHDVDLLPLSTGNIYGCTKKPRHMSSSLDTFRYNLPYLTLFGGVSSIQTDQFVSVNGFSNLFYGWGGEDDDLYNRLELYNLNPYRFAPELSKYTMLAHRRAKANNERYKTAKYSLENHQLDGLKSLGNYSVELRPLYTLINAS